MRGYLMVTRTFRNPGANEPVDAEIYVIFRADNLCQALTREVRGQVEIPKWLSV